VTRAVALLAEAQDGTQTQKRAAAMRELAMLVGAVVIARASDPETARAMLAACRVEEEK
jgi:TetR/AcrR family transcriptional repressor of nem operon